MDEAEAEALTEWARDNAISESYAVRVAIRLLLGLSIPAAFRREGHDQHAVGAAR